MQSIVLFLIRAYQKFPFIPSGICRFTPTCSRYTYQAVEKYGALRGLWTGLKRIARCHPWNKGGSDPLV